MYRNFHSEIQWDNFQTGRNERHLLTSVTAVYSLSMNAPQASGMCSIACQSDGWIKTYQGEGKNTAPSVKHRQIKVAPPSCQH